MELDFKSENGVTVLTMSGRLDSATSCPAEQKISEELSRGGSWIVLMRDLEYVSSAGLRVFLLMAKRLRAAGGKLALAQPAPGVREVLDISGFSTIFTICGDLNDARTALQ